MLDVGREWIMSPDGMIMYTPTWHRYRGPLAGAALLICFVTASTMDYRDQLAAEQQAKDNLKVQLDYMQRMRNDAETKRGNVYYIIEAKSHTEAYQKLRDLDFGIQSERSNLLTINGDKDVLKTRT